MPRSASYKPLPVIPTYPEGEFCNGCTYQPTGVRRVLPDGDGTSGIALIGDSPWKEEVSVGRNFSGASGNWLDTILSKRGLDRSTLSVANALWCKPPALGMNDSFNKDGSFEFPEAAQAYETCKPYLDSFIADRLPRVLVSMGNVALRRVTGYEGIEANHGYVLPSLYNIPAVPTFHPSSILQGNWKYTIAFVLALAKAVSIADGSYQATKVEVVEDPPPTYLEPPFGRDIPWLMCDIETPRSLKQTEEEAEDDPSYNIIRIGFSVAPWSGVSVPFEGDYIRRAKVLVRRARHLLFWNKDYDLPRLKAAGFELHPDVVIIDAMWAWHFLYSDLPKTLAFASPFFYNGAPWKHLGSQRPAFYNGMDNAIQMGNWYGIRAALENEGRFNRFWNHCVRIDPYYISMGKAGVMVDKEAREPFMDALAEEAHKELVKVQELLPPNIQYDKKTEVLTKKPVPSKAKVKALKSRFLSLTRIEQSAEPARHRDGTLVLTQGGDNLGKPIWIRHNPFNPNSRPHLLSLFEALGVKPPKARGEDRESTEAKYLKRITKYPIFRHVVNYKQRSKLISTYNWPLDEHDRAHTTYGYHPSTWRSSSRRSNLGNIPKRNDLANLFRRVLVAAPGHKLIELDRSALEAVLVGIWAKSPEYIKLAKAGVHSNLVSYVLGEPVDWKVIQDTPLKELQKLLKTFKKRASTEIYEGCKRCIHATNYLISAFGLHDEYEEFFPTEYDAQKMQDIYLNSPAGQAVRRYHKETLDEVYRKKYIDNHFQYRHYFYGPLFKFNKRAKKWEVDHEGDAKRAVAFRPQSDGAAIQREDILGLGSDPELAAQLRLPTYDSLVVEAPNHLVDRVIEWLVTQFSKPIPEIGNDTIGFEVKVGMNAAPKDYAGPGSNPEGMEEISI